MEKFDTAALSLSASSGSGTILKKPNVGGGPWP
jgi:hypothetical protein